MNQIVHHHVCNMYVLFITLTYILIKSFHKQERHSQLSIVKWIAYKHINLSSSVQKTQGTHFHPVNAWTVEPEYKSRCGSRKVTCPSPVECDDTQTEQPVPCYHSRPVHKQVATHAD